MRSADSMVLAATSHSQLGAADAPPPPPSSSSLPISRSPYPPIPLTDVPSSAPVLSVEGHIEDDAFNPFISRDEETRYSETGLASVPEEDEVSEDALFGHVHALRPSPFDDDIEAERRMYEAQQLLRKSENEMDHLVPTTIRHVPPVEPPNEGNPNDDDSNDEDDAPPPPCAPPPEDLVCTEWSGKYTCINISPGVAACVDESGREREKEEEKEKEEEREREKKRKKNINRGFHLFLMS